MGHCFQAKGKGPYVRTGKDCVLWCGGKHPLHQDQGGGFDIVVHCELCREVRYQVFIFHLEVSQGSKVYHSHWGGFANLDRSIRGISELHYPVGIH